MLCYLAVLLQDGLCCCTDASGEVHDEAAIKAVENAAMSKLSASSTVSKSLPYTLQTITGCQIVRVL
jgi:hypothetical protein